MKNVIITILAILVLGMGGYLVYDKVIDKEVDSINKQQNSTVIENSNDNETILESNEFDANYISKEIDNIKKDQTINLVQKIEKILNLIHKDYYKIILGNEAKYICSLDQDNDYNCNFNYVIDSETFTSSLLVDKSESYIYDEKYIEIADNPDIEGITLSEYLNKLRYEAYSFKLKEKLGFDVFSGYAESIYNKYISDSAKVCIGYTNTKDYFYINVNEVNSPKEGWYYFDSTTGECSYMVRQVAQYKIDKNTYNYELIEK